MQNIFNRSNNNQINIPIKCIHYYSLFIFPTGVTMCRCVYDYLGVRCMRQTADVSEERLVAARRRQAVESTCWQLVVVIVDDVGAVEDAEETEDESPVSVICHTPPVVALTCQVGEGDERGFVVCVYEHLQCQR